MLPLHQALAAEHVRDLRAAADRYRLIAISRSGRTSAWQRAAARGHTTLTRLRGWVRRGQLGPAPNYCTTC